MKRMFTLLMLVTLLALTFSALGVSPANADPSDTIDPIVVVPGDMTVEATSASGATVSFDVIATDETSPAHPAVTCDWLSGSTFSLGATPVTCQATDDANNTGYGYFNVTVQDTTPPFLSLPANIIVPQSNSAGSVVNFPAGAWDGVDANPTVVCVPPGGSVFPVGATTVICTATDDYANASNGSFTVTVIGGVNLLLNPGFDGFTAIPKAWNYSILNNPVSSLTDCVYFLSPTCSLKLTAGASTKIVTQTVKYNGVASNRFSYGLFSAANGVANTGLCKVEVALFNRYNRVMYTEFGDCTNGTHGWELTQRLFIAPATFTSIRYRIYSQKAYGTAWFDDGFIYQVPSKLTSP